VQHYALPGVEPPKLSPVERKSERWNIYMPRWIRQRIEQAAALEGLSPSQFGSSSLVVSQDSAGPSFLQQPTAPRSRWAHLGHQRCTQRVPRRRGPASGCTASAPALATLRARQRAAAGSSRGRPSGRKASSPAPASRASAACCRPPSRASGGAGRECRASIPAPMAAMAVVWGRAVRLAAGRRRPSGG
jgi:hypothetical protein